MKGTAVVVRAAAAELLQIFKVCMYSYLQYYKYVNAAAMTTSTERKDYGSDSTMGSVVPIQTPNGWQTAVLIAQDRLLTAFLIGTDNRSLV